MGNNSSPIETLKRWLSIIVAIGLWVISIYFNTSGFKFETNTIGLERTASIITSGIGIFLGLSITVLQLNLNDVGKGGPVNLTILFLGVGAYGYGLITDFIGIWTKQGHHDVSLNGIFTDFVPALFCVFLSIIIEFAPEAMLAKGLMGRRGSTEGDVLKAMANGVQSLRSNTNGHKPRERERIESYTRIP